MDDKTDLTKPQDLNPASWGFANTLANLFWPEAVGVSRFALFRAPVGNPGNISLVTADLTGRRYVDTPGPGEFLYWLAPVSESGIGQAIGPVRPQATLAKFPAFGTTRVSTLQDPPYLRVPLPFTTGMLNLAVEDAASVRIVSSSGLKAAAREMMPGVASIIVQVPENTKLGETFPLVISAKSGGKTVRTTVHVITGLDLMAGLPRGTMPAPGGTLHWQRDPSKESTKSPKHSVVIEDSPEVSPSIKMQAWNSNNRITYPLATGNPGAWQAEGLFKLIERAGGTTSGILVSDAEGKPIADLKFEQKKINGENNGVVTAQKELLIGNDDDYRAIVLKQWQSFQIEARSGKIAFTFGQGANQRTLEAPALEGSTWNQPASFEIYQGGKSSGRSLAAGNLSFTMIPESPNPPKN